MLITRALLSPDQRQLSAVLRRVLLSSLLIAQMGVQSGTANAESSRSGVGQSPSTASINATSRPVAVTWPQLTPLQRAALGPLEGHWDEMSDAQKRKWIALSGNYTSLSQDERRTLHSRMTEWAALSPRDRAQARLNFAEVKQVPAEDRKAKWAAYQALTDAQRSALADKAAPRPRSAAIPIRPIPTQKLVEMPRSVPGEHGARIAIGAADRARITGMPMPVTPSPMMQPDSPAPTGDTVPASSLPTVPNSTPTDAPAASAN